MGLGFPLIIAGLLLILLRSTGARGSISIGRSGISASGTVPFLLVVLGVAIELLEQGLLRFP